MEESVHKGKDVIMKLMKSSLGALEASNRIEDNRNNCIDYHCHFHNVQLESWLK